MNNKKNVAKEVSELRKLDDQHNDLHQKLDELLLLLEKSNLDSDSIKSIQHRFNSALETKDVDKRTIKEFQKFDELSETASREDLLEEFSVLLTNTRIDSTATSKFIKKERVSRVVLAIISVIMIALGFAMIIMPAPPYFEMFTIYYINHDDGITIMDVISLLIILAGIYFLIRSFYRKTSVRPN